MAAKRLTTAKIRSLKQIGCYGDGRGGHGLQIRVHRTVDGDVSKSWRQKLTIGDKPTTVGLGPWPLVSLEDARKAAFVNRAKVYQGIDPRTGVAMVAASVAPVAPVTPDAPTFDAAAEATIRLHRDAWKQGSSTEARWRRGLAGLPFAQKPVDAVPPGDVLAVVQPDWLRTPDAARSRLNVIRAVFLWSIGAGYRSDDPTVAVSAALPRQAARPKHHAAVLVKDIPQAFAALGECSRSRKLTRLAVQFLVLTAARRKEVAEATWSDIWDGETWTKPAGKTKTDREHRVPLSAGALAVLDSAARETGNRAGLIFPSKKGTAIGASSFRKTLSVCGITATVHGMRSCFRDWAAETGVAREVAEASLAHVVGGVEGAYFRSDLFERRREVMEAWSAYLA